MLLAWKEGGGGGRQCRGSYRNVWIQYRTWGRGGGGGVVTPWQGGWVVATNIHINKTVLSHCIFLYINSIFKVWWPSVLIIATIIDKCIILWSIISRSDKYFSVLNKNLVFYVGIRNSYRYRPHFIRPLYITCNRIVVSVQITLSRLSWLTHELLSVKRWQNDLTSLAGKARTCTGQDSLIQEKHVPYVVSLQWSTFNFDIDT